MVAKFELVLYGDTLVKEPAIDFLFLQDKEILKT